MTILFQKIKHNRHFKDFKGYESRQWEENINYEWKTVTFYYCTRKPLYPPTHKVNTAFVKCSYSVPEIVIITKNKIVTIFKIKRLCYHIYTLIFIMSNAVNSHKFSKFCNRTSVVYFLSCCTLIAQSFLLWDLWLI